MKVTQTYIVWYNDEWEVLYKTENGFFIRSGENLIEVDRYKAEFLID